MVVAHSIQFSAAFALGDARRPLRIARLRRAYGLPNADGRTGDESDGDECRGSQNGSISLPEFAKTVQDARRSGRHRLVIQEPLKILREAVGGLVASVAILGERLQHDPVQLAFQKS